VLPDWSDLDTSTAFDTRPHCSSAVRGRTIAAVFKISEAGLKGTDRPSGEFPADFSPIEGCQRRGVWRVSVYGGPLGVAG
jgi:hypothetical protein